jgi:hypothetical protein
MDFVRIARNVRARLDRQGFIKTQSVLNEWNYGLQDPAPSDLQRATFLSAALTYMQDAPVDISAIYRTDNVFGKDGATPDKVGHALIAHGQMKDTPLRLKVIGADDLGFAVQAGRSGDGKTVQVLISNYQIPAEYIGSRAPRPNVLSVPNVFDVTLLERRTVQYRNNSGYALTIGGLAPGHRYSVQRYRVSKDRDLTLIDQTIQTGEKVRLSAQLPPPGIELVVLRAQIPE